MKRYITLLAAIIAVIGAMAQQQGQRQQMTDEERQQWLSELRAFKHEFFARELGLSSEQQQAFFPIYDEMDDQVMAINAEMRELESSLQRADSVTDDEYAEAAQALFEQKQREAQIELEYFAKFKEVLTPEQLFKLKSVERKFTRQLVNFQRKHGQQRQPQRQQKP